MRTIIFLLLVSVVLSSASCKKKCKAGNGGNLTLALYPQHHTIPVLSKAAYPDSAFVKFNATDFPGIHASDYDIVQVAPAGSDHVNITGLQCGQYFIYMTGYDSSIHKRVADGIPYNTDQKNGTLNLNVPISE